MKQLTDLVFTNTYSNLTSDELIVRVKSRLSDFRFSHCVRTAKTAAELAKQNDVNPNLAKIAGFLHDYAKEIPVDEYRKTIQAQGFDPDLLNWNRGIWHGIVGAWYVENELGITDQRILNAIRNHTTGDPNMAELDKIIFMADFIEPGRNFEGVQKARELTALSLDAGVGFQLRHTISYLVLQQVPIYPKTIQTYNVFGIKHEI